jgi:hypothetical protein
MLFTSHPIQNAYVNSNNQLFDAEPELGSTCQTGMSNANVQPEIQGSATQSMVARLLHPEDISVGDNVALAIQSYDYPSFCWYMADPAIMPPDQTIRLSFVPQDRSKPFKVIAVCLPFVLCEKVDGKFQTFDVRTVQLMRLEPGFAEAARMGYASKKRRKELIAEREARKQAKAQQDQEGASEDSFELGDGVMFEDSSLSRDSAQVVLFEFTVQVPLADSENVGGFFSVVVSQS